jgi:hypothetical protein
MKVKPFPQELQTPSAMRSAHVTPRKKTQNSSPKRSDSVFLPVYEAIPAKCRFCPQITA